jgi:hypothetical protein
MGPGCCALQLQNFGLAQTLAVVALLKASLGRIDFGFDNNVGKVGKGKVYDFYGYYRILRCGTFGCHIFNINYIKIQLLKGNADVLVKGMWKIRTEFCLKEL